MGFNGMSMYTYCKNIENWDVSFKSATQSRLKISCPSMKLALICDLDRVFCRVYGGTSIKLHYLRSQSVINNQC